MEYREIMSLWEGLQEIANLEFPMDISYSLAYNIKELTPTVQSYEDNYNNIIKRYGTLDNESQLYKVPEEFLEVTQNELNDLNQQSVFINLKTIPFSALQSGNVKISPLKLQKLLPIISEES